jgi:hypothetical protein
MISKSPGTPCNRALFRLVGFWASTVVNLLFLIPVAINSDEYGLPSMEEYPLPLLIPWVVNGILLLGPSIIVSSEFAVGYITSLGILAVASLLYVPSCLVTCIITGGVLEIISLDLGQAFSFPECFLLMYVLAWLAMAGWFSQRIYRRNCTDGRPGATGRPPVAPMRQYK